MYRDVENELITGKAEDIESDLIIAISDEKPTEMGETKTSTVQMMTRQAKSGKLPTSKTFTVKQRKDGCCREDTTKIKMRESEF